MFFVQLFPFTRLPIPDPVVIPWVMPGDYLFPRSDVEWNIIGFDKT
jgi:hypothetical protein